jgi:hypothetical protein
MNPFRVSGHFATRSSVLEEARANKDKPPDVEHLNSLISIAVTNNRYLLRLLHIHRYLRKRRRMLAGQPKEPYIDI